MADRVKEVAKEEADRLKSLTVEAARSAAYLYPLRVGLGIGDNFPFAAEALHVSD